MTILESPASAGGLACAFRSGALGAEASDPTGSCLGVAGGGDLVRCSTVYVPPF
jgi:hypothetical protein